MFKTICFLSEILLKWDQLHQQKHIQQPTAWRYFTSVLTIHLAAKKVSSITEHFVTTW